MFLLLHRIPTKKKTTTKISTNEIHTYCVTQCICCCCCHLFCFETQRKNFTILTESTKGPTDDETKGCKNVWNKHQSSLIRNVINHCTLRLIRVWWTDTCSDWMNEQTCMDCMNECTLECANVWSYMKKSKFTGVCVLFFFFGRF